MAVRSRKIAPESPTAIEEGFTQRKERESGEGCSRGSISDDQVQLMTADDHHEDRSRKISLQPSSLTLDDAIIDRDTRGEVRPESRIGKRFVRYRNSWIGDDTVTLNLKSFRTTAAAASLIEEVDEASEDGDVESDLEAGTEPSKALLAYFIWLSRSPSEDVDFQLMEQFLVEGADINAATDTGATVIHDVASNWDVKVAEFLLERGANIHAVNSIGQTPLHLAASTDHVEMVRWLLQRGAHLDAVTTLESQTPLHYAARNDSLEALQVLIDSGGNYEVCDYKGRTPLHLAAEFDRTVAAEHLLSLDPPAKCRVTDNRGNHAITSMIRTMPDVAELALNQLHRIAPADRKQFFLLNHLEPEDVQQAECGIKLPFAMAVERRQYGILSHPVMQELIRHKWARCVRWTFYPSFAAYILFVLSWSLLIAYPSVQEKHKYSFPRDLWRIVLVVIALGTLGFELVDETLEILRSRRKHKAYTKLRSRDLEDDLKKTDPSLPEERKYLEHELASANKSPSNYFKDPWNIIDIVCYINLFILIVMHSLDVGFHVEELALWTARLSCPAVVLIWVRILKYARAFRSIGPLIAIIGQLIGDIVRFFVIYGIFFIPYAICFWVVFGGERASGQPYNEDLTKVYRTVIMVFRMGLIDDYPYRTLRDIDELMSSILVVTFLLIAGVIGLNLFIALLSDTFQRVYDNARANALLQQAELILSYEEKVCLCVYNSYLRHIQNQCNPSSTYYDDDDTKKEQPGELQKITHQIHSIVSELQTERTAEEGKVQSSALDALTVRIAQQEEKMSAMNQTLSEIKTLLDGLQLATITNNTSAPPYSADERVVPDFDGHTTAALETADHHQKYWKLNTTIPVAAEIPLAAKFHQTRNLPPLHASLSSLGGRGGHPYTYKQLMNEGETMKDAEILKDYQSPSEIGLQPCHSSPSYLDYTSASCSTLSLTASSSHRRVRKMKKAQAKDFKWKHKH